MSAGGWDPAERHTGFMVSPALILESTPEIFTLKGGTAKIEKKIISINYESNIQSNFKICLFL